MLLKAQEVMQDSLQQLDKKLDPLGRCPTRDR